MESVQNIRELITNGILPSDEQFDALLPESLRKHADQHFSGVYVIEQATRFLADQNAPAILDVGSGSGKFCLIGALIHVNAHFTGVEYREELVAISQKLAQDFKIENIAFFHQNILDVHFQFFNGFFMFNPFHEHRQSSARMAGFFDHERSAEAYQNHIYNELSAIQHPAKLVTHYIDPNLIPESFRCVDQKMGGTLLFWQTHH